MALTEGYIPTADGVRLFFRQINHSLRALVIPNGPPLLEEFARVANGRTIIAYDARNRGQSDLIEDETKIAKGIVHDVDDIEAVRAHFDVATIDLLGHSYMGLAVILYAMRHPQHVRSIVQIGAVGPRPATQYSADLSYVDAVMNAAMTELRALWSRPTSADPEAACRELWMALRPIYVVTPSDVNKLDSWQRCHLATERGAARYATETLIPSYMGMNITSNDVAAVTMPVLTIHGRKDRSAPYGGGRDWSRLLPNSRLLTIGEGGHLPWIDAPNEVFPEIDHFLRSE
jgi:pimeloyl-ACP methyl ester carboxylesterase